MQETEVVTIKEFYDVTGSDYNDAIKRFMDERRLEKFVKMFLDDPSYRDLETCLAQSDLEEAFHAVHTLKGVCLNLSFSRFYESASAVTETLRSAKSDREQLGPVYSCMEVLRKDYSAIIAAIHQIGQ